MVSEQTLEPYKRQKNPKTLEFWNILRFFFAVIFLACHGGRYGQGCNNICGHCINQTVCNHIDGTCLSGCDPGYQGILCKLSNYDRHLLFWHSSFVLNLLTRLHFGIIYTKASFIPRLLSKSYSTHLTWYKWIEIKIQQVKYFIEECSKLIHAE